MTQLSPKQVHGLEEALQKLEELEQRIVKLEEQAKNFITRDELMQLIQVGAEAYQRGFNGAATSATPATP